MAVTPVTEPSYPEEVDFPFAENELARAHFVGDFQPFPQEAFTGSMTCRTFKIPFVDPTTPASDHPLTAIQSIVSEKLGYCTVDADTNKLVRFLPEVDFNFRHLVACRCQVWTMSYTGMDPASDPDTLPPMASGNWYKWALVRVHYAAPRFHLGERVSPTSQYGVQLDEEIDRFAFKTCTRGISYVTVKPGPYVWKALSGPNAEIKFEIPQVVAYESIDVWLLGWPARSLPIETFDICKGKCNASAMVLPDNQPSFFVYPAQTLALQTYSLFDDKYPNGDALMHACLHFKRAPNNDTGSGSDNPYGWNGLIYPGTTTYMEVVRRDGSGLVPTSDYYENLFKPFGA